MINCLILEDERSAQEVLQEYITKTPFIKGLGVYESGLDIPLKQLQQTDILFLDIQLPELNGLSFLKTLTNPPKVIVTTAYPNFAIAAFEEAVMDYLMKPFSFERFFKAVTRARNQLLIEQKDFNRQVFLYADKTIYKINIDDIIYLKAEVDYVKVVTKDEKILILDSLINWKEKLSKYRFSQVHRSFVINNDKITKIYGNHVFIGDISFPIGKTHKDLFFKSINYIQN